uniref:HM00052 protein n=1 Tax=Heliconius melpomene TaxID=34740 RepID=D0ABA0_HELME|nr:HM00052 [Heliconius melpomene]CBH09296.1 HM00052 [Heliconius melpomene]
MSSFYRTTRCCTDDDEDDADDNDAIYDEDDDESDESEKDTESSCGGGVQRREATCVRADGRALHPAQCAHAQMPTLVQPCELLAVSQAHSIRHSIELMYLNKVVNGYILLLHTQVPCPRDCEVGEWSEWGACQPTDGCPLFPVQQLTTTGIYILRKPKEPGVVVELQLEVRDAGLLAPVIAWCPRGGLGPLVPRPAPRQGTLARAGLDDGIYWHMQHRDGEPFNESDDEEPCIEEGEMNRDVMCVQNNADVVREALCAPLRRPASRRACTVRCKRGCRVEAWMPWSPCPNTCDPGKQVRVRTVRGGPNCGPLQETRACAVARSCRARDAAWVAGEWSTCRLPPGQRCGVGYRIRSIWCGSDSHRVEAGACAGALVPPAVAACKVSCDSMVILACDVICADPLKIECGEGRSLRAARCLVGRRDVPMDVCKKYHPLTGPRRVREAATDGFTYDSEFGSLLRGTCTVRCARDCAAGAWAAWGPCAAEPGSRAAFRFRTRCTDGRESKLEDMTCETSGAGPAPARDAPCRAPCPADCVVSAWSEWSPCEQTKWGGRRDRTRVVLRAADEGGAACPHLVAAEPCAPHSYSWHVAPWDDCQPLGGSPCGEGTKKRSVRCLRSDGLFVNDSYCPKFKEAQRLVVMQGHKRATVPLEGMEYLIFSYPRSGNMAKHSVEFRHSIRETFRFRRKTSSGEEADTACGWGVKLSHARCELTGVSDEPSDAFLQPWRCAAALPGRIVTPPLHHQKGPASSHILNVIYIYISITNRYVTIEWANCTGDADEIPDLLAVERDDKPRRAWLDRSRNVYHDGYIEGSTSVLAVVWTATIFLSLYGAFMLYRGVLRCLRSRKLKSITKV